MVEKAIYYRENQKTEFNWKCPHCNHISFWNWIVKYNNNRCPKCKAWAKKW